MSPAGFEPAIPATERRQTHALDRATTGGYPKMKLTASRFGDWMFPAPGKSGVEYQLTWIG